MKLLMIGPFPPVLNGVTISNDFLFKSFIAKGLDVRKINTETGKIASMQGDKLSLAKILAFLTIYKNIFKINGRTAVYMAVGQSFWGLTKYSPFILYCKLFGIPYILHIHGGYLCHAYNKMSTAKKFIFRSLLVKSDSVIALSTSLAEHIKETFPSANVQVVENFYDPQLITSPINRSEHTTPRFLFLSNLMLGKGILDFLDALVILKTEKKVHFQVALAGTIEKGIGTLLSEKIKLLGDSIYFYGIADFDKKKELLYWSDIFVLPTWYIMEGQPLSIIEAYVTGNAVVSTHQGGIKDISHYGSFFKTEIQNPSALAATLETVIAQLSNLHASLSVTMQAAQQRFNPENFLYKMEAIVNPTAVQAETRIVLEHVVSNQ